MKHEWHVEVKDHEGAPIEDATVALQPEIFPEALGMTYPFHDMPGTHDHQGGGRYVSFTLQMQVGRWYLVVQHAEKSQVVQPLSMRENAAGEFFANPRRNELAATVSFSAETIESEQGPVRKTVFRVTLFPASEVVLMSGTEYNSKGTRFLAFALGRRDVLFREKKIDAGTPVTVLSCDNRCIATFVKAHRGWFDVQALLDPPPGVRAGRAHARRDESDPTALGKALVAAGALSIVHLYKHLDAVGQRRPGTIKEVSIFSHSFQNGPLLYNTYQDSLHAQSESRDPNDLDGRPKDFADENVNGNAAHQGWPNMKAAMAADGVWQLWGCSADGRLRQQQNDAVDNASRGDDAFFTVRYSDPGYSAYEERLTRALVIFRINGIFKEASYAAQAAKHLDVPVFAAPPGVGALFLRKNGISVMRCVESSYRKVYQFLRDEFGPESEPTADPFNEGFVDYHALQARADPPQLEPRAPFYMLKKWFRGSTENPVTTIEFPETPRFEHAGTDFRLRDREMTLDGRQGVRYLLDAPGDARDRAYFFTGDEIFFVNRDAGGDFTVLENI